MSALRTWSVTCTFLVLHEFGQRKTESRQRFHRVCVPYFPFMYIIRSLLFQERSDFLKFAATGAGIVEEVAEFARVGLDFGDILLVPRITLQNENLMLWPA